MSRLHPRLYSATRGWAFALVAFLTFAGIWYASPENLPVVIYKLGLVTLAGYVGYWLDRHLFPYARPHEFLPDFVADDAVGDRTAVIAQAAMIRRAIIVAASVIGFALAL